VLRQAQHDRLGRGVVQRTANVGVRSAILWGALALLTLWRLAELFWSPWPLFFDEAQYWDWAQRPAFGYYSKPPMLAWIIALTTSLCGEGEACVRLASAPLHAGTAIVIYRLGCDLWEARVGVWAALLYVSLPAVTVSSGIASTDAPLLFFWAAALLCFRRALVGNDALWWAGLGLAIGLGLLSKYTMILFPLCALLYCALRPDRRALLGNGRAWAALGLAFLVLAPNLYWNAGNGFASIAHTAANANLGGRLFNPGKFLEFFGAQFAVFGPLAMAALIWMAARPKPLLAREPAMFLACFSLPVLALFLGQGFLSRAHANWAAVTYVGASLLVAELALARARWILTGSLALHLVLSFAYYRFDTLVRIAGIELGVRQDPFQRLRGWDALGREVRAALNRRPGAYLLADEREHLVELLYYARPAWPTIKWNPSSRVTDHYDLTTDIRAHADREFLLVTRQAGAPHVLAHFASSERLPDARVALAYGGELRYELYVLKGFRGY
jgi:Dolichyl-phosphate-mannose-protein mannosyltransferase